MSETPLRQTIWGLSSAGRASALQAEGHRFEPYRPHTKTKYGGIAQLARAHGSYPWCREFKSPFRYYERKAICEKRVAFFAFSCLFWKRIKRIINFPETPCNFRFFALKYSRYANRLGRRGVRRKLLSERTVHRLEDGFRGRARKVASEPESWIISGVRSVSKRTLQSGFRRSRGSRLIRVKETAVASGSSDKVRNKGGTAELFALYAERRFCIKGFLYLL